jgi:hypothetical protein
VTATRLEHPAYQLRGKLENRETAYRRPDPTDVIALGAARLAPGKVLGNPAALGLIDLAV